jgi:hypothetical protein
MTDLDLGARCDAHTGEALQPRCKLCQLLNREYHVLGIEGGESE